MDKNHIDHVTDSVMDVYKRVNPSLVSNITSAGKKNAYFSKWRDLIIKKLKLPPVVFQDSSLLDVGCGTGEKSLVYAVLGAKVLGLDANEKAIALARKLATKWGFGQGHRKAEFSVRSVFDIDINQSFDIIVSDGMIHHTADSKGAFNRFASMLKPGGVLLLGLAEPCGFFQRQLQRYFVNRIAEGHDEKVKVNTAKTLFKEKLRRASRASGRSVESTAYDSFINPHVSPIAFQDIKNWMSEYNIHLDCTWPPSELPLRTDSQYHPDIESNNLSVLAWESVMRLFWMLNDKDDRDLFREYTNHNSSLLSFLNQIPSICNDTALNTGKLKAALEKVGEIKTTPLPGYAVKEDMMLLIEEILKIDRQINIMKSKGQAAKTIAEKIKFKRLFSGFSGVGMVYYRGTKDIDTAGAKG